MASLAEILLGDHPKLVPMRGHRTPDLASGIDLLLFFLFLQNQSQNDANTRKKRHDPTHNYSASRLPAAARDRSAQPAQPVLLPLPDLEHGLTV